MTAAVAGRGHGKVILLGEHAAVYGHPVVAGALDRGVTLRATAAPGPLALTVDGWGLAVTAGDDHPVATALAAIAAGLEVTDGWRLAGASDLPPAAGLGSSAALAVAIVRAWRWRLDVRSPTTRSRRWRPAVSARSTATRAASTSRWRPAAGSGGSCAAPA